MLIQSTISVIISFFRFSSKLLNGRKQKSEITEDIVINNEANVAGKFIFLAS